MDRHERTRDHEQHATARASHFRRSLRPLKGMHGGKYCAFYIGEKCDTNFPLSSVSWEDACASL